MERSRLDHSLSSIARSEWPMGTVVDLPPREIFDIGKQVTIQNRRPTAYPEILRRNYTPASAAIVRHLQG